MALKKDIELNTGIVVGYHRIQHYIVSINSHIWVEVKSYISHSKRQEEQRVLALDNEEAWWDGYCISHCFSLPYKENFTVQEVYEELKKMPMFQGAVDC